MCCQSGQVCLHELCQLHSCACGGAAPSVHRALAPPHSLQPLGFGARHSAQRLLQHLLPRLPHTAL